jgi:hypothetical protein
MPILPVIWFKLKLLGKISASSKNENEKLRKKTLTFVAIESIYLKAVIEEIC